MALEMIIAVLVGTVCAAIINYVADVLPVARRFELAKCAKCGEKIPWYRYFLPGKCPSCQAKFSIRHYLVFAGIIVFYFFYTLFKVQSLTDLIVDFAIFAYFATIIVIDIEHRLILHKITIFGAVIMSVIGSINHGVTSTVLGGVIGLAVMLMLYFLGIWFSKIMSRSRGTEIEEGLGFGDVTLSGVCGLLLGWPGISIGLFSGILLGGLFAVILLVIGWIRKQYAPFTVIAYGPFLSIAVIVLWMMR